MYFLETLYSGFLSKQSFTIVFKQKRKFLSYLDNKATFLFFKKLINSPFLLFAAFFTSSKKFCEVIISSMGISKEDNSSKTSNIQSFTFAFRLFFFSSKYISLLYFRTRSHISL